ncbi:hypothetical protein D3C87_1966550 [compost metagenome]
MPAEALRRRPGHRQPAFDLGAYRNEPPLLLPADQTGIAAGFAFTVITDLLAEKAGANQDFFHAFRPPFILF